MHISYNWLKTYLDIDLPAEEVAAILTNIGLEVEGTEHLENIKGGLEGLVVGQVTELKQHPDADKLKVATVDINSGTPLQIVCGANNIAKDQKVVVAPVGSTIYPIGHDPIKLKKAKLRGIESHGMICAEDEIGLGKSHEGIMVLPDDYKMGSLLKDYYNIEQDVIFEIGLTPNRSDALSHIGVARDLAVALKINHDFKGALKWPSVESYPTANNSLDIEIEVKDPEACPRYAGVCINNLTVKDSPLWLQNRLRSIGLSPINNIVDVTNFILHELGQPLHAFDAQEIKGNKIIVQKLPEDTVFTTLDEKKRKLQAEDLIICNASAPMCIAGVFGGVQSGVKPSTTSIFLESAYFDPDHIRKTSNKHGLRTDAAIRFEKGIDPDRVIYSLKRAAMVIVEIAGGEIASEIKDVYSQPIEPYKVTLRFNRVNTLLGFDIAKETIKHILTALEIQIDKEDDQKLVVKVPRYRSDVTREADLIEEIIRIIGFESVPTSITSKSSLAYSPKLNTDQLYNATADYLTNNGFYETLGTSLTNSKHFDQVLNDYKTSIIPLLSTSSADLDVLRPTMLLSSLEAVAYNVNRKNENLRLYELGKTYHKVKDDVFTEKSLLTLTISGKNEGNWLQKTEKASFYYLKSIVENIFKISNAAFSSIEAIDDNYFEEGAVYKKGKKPLAKIGKVKSDIAKKMNVKQVVYYAEIDWKMLCQLHKSEVFYQPISKYPGTQRDLALILDKQISFGEIEKIAKTVDKTILQQVSLFDVYEDNKIGKDKKSYAVSFDFQHQNRTLTDKEIDAIMNKLMTSYEKDLGAVIRK